MIRFRNYFISGLIAILPIALSLWILTYVFRLLDSIFGEPFRRLFGFHIPGLGLILSVLFVFMVGMIISNVIGKRISGWIEGLLERIPILKNIYMPLKDIMNNFSDKRSNNFKQAVLVEYPRAGLHSIGFVTRENIFIDGKRKTIVFIPTTPNPTSGFIIYVEPNDYQMLDIPVEAALRTIISLGSLTPEQIIVKRA